MPHLPSGTGQGREEEVNRKGGVMAKMHDWRKGDWVAQLICARCGATRWGKPGGWGRAMKDGKPVKYCEGEEKPALK